MKQKSVRLNFIMNALLSVSGLLFPLITFPYITRVLLPVGVGKVSFATSLIAYFSMLAQLGIPTYGIRECARVRDDRAALSRTVHELLGISLVMDCVSYALLALALAFVPRLAEERLLYIIISATILLNSLGMEWLYKGLEQYSYITVRSIACNLVALAAMFLLVRSEKDYLLYGGISIFASSASDLLNLLHARRYVDLRRPRDCRWRKHLKPVLVFFAIACATTVYTNLDVLMLGFLKTEESVGYYTAAVKSKGFLVSLITSLGAVLLPRMTYYIQNGNRADFRRLTGKALHFIFLASVPLLVYFELFARQVILFLSGRAFLPAVEPMRVIMPTMVLIGLTNLMGIQVLVPTGREKTVLLSVAIGAGVDLVLNAVLIPPLAATGAAVGTLVAEIAVLLVQYRALKTELREAFAAIPYGSILAGTVLGALASFWVLFLQLGSFPALVLSAVLFFGVDLACLTLRKEPMVREIWQLAASWLHRADAGQPPQE